MVRSPGEYPPQILPAGWVNRKDSENRWVIINEKTKNCYLQEPMWQIAFKCFLLFSLALPPYFAIYTAIHLARLVIVPILHGFTVSWREQIWAVVRIPFYFLALEYAALLGVFKPLEGRAFFGELESSLHGEKRRKDCVRYEDEIPFGTLCCETLSRRKDPRTFFVGFCMQPLKKAQSFPVV